MNLYLMNDLNLEVLGIATNEKFMELVKDQYRVGYKFVKVNNYPQHIEVWFKDDNSMCLLSYGKNSDSINHVNITRSDIDFMRGELS